MNTSGTINAADWLTVLCLFLFASGILSCQYFQKEEEILPEVVTQSDIRLSFSNSGEIKEFQVDNGLLTVTTFMRAHSGWCVEDKKTGLQADFRAELTPVEQNSLVQKGMIEELGVELDCRYEVDGELLKVTCDIASTIEEDRALDLTFRLPVDNKGWYWEGSIDQRQEIKPLQRYECGHVTLSHHEPVMYYNVFRGSLPYYPFACVSSPDKKIGISAAIPPDVLVRNRMWYESQLFRIAFHVGLSPDYRLPNRASVSFILFRHDPEWGFRSTIVKYQSIFPDYFIPDTLHTGLMRVSGNIRPFDAENFGVHVIGGDVYQAQSFDEYVQRSGARSDIARGEEVFPYLTISQRQIFDLPTIPGSEDEALEMFDEWNTQDVFYYQCPEPDNSFQSVSQLKDIIRNSNIYTPGQEPAFLVRHFWRSHVITFPLNPSYYLFKDSAAVTIGKYTANEYFPNVIEPFRNAAGVYVSSVSRWARLYNFRHDHFRYANYPLTYHPDSLLICLSNVSSTCELLDTLRQNTRHRNLNLCIGGISLGDIALAHRGDYLETGLSQEELKDGDKLRWFRVIAGPKPVFLRFPDTLASIKEVDNHFNFCAAMGYFTNFTSKFNVQSSLDSLIVERRKTYTPLLNSLNNVQWQPITYGSVTNDSLIIERFGRYADPGLFFTVYNPYPKVVSGIVSISLWDLKLPASTILEDALNPENRPSLYIDTQGRIHTNIALQPYTAIALHVTY